jgi:hypothetical protein
MKCAPKAFQVGCETGIGEEFRGVDRGYNTHGSKVSDFAQAIRFAADPFAKVEDGGKEWHDPGYSISSGSRDQARRSKQSRPEQRT